MFKTRQILRKLLPNSSTILFFIITIFLVFNFVSYKLLLKILEDNHTKNQEISFYLIQRETSNLLTKLLYKYSQQKDKIRKTNKTQIFLIFLHQNKLKSIKLHQSSKKHTRLG